MNIALQNTLGSSFTLNVFVGSRDPRTTMNLAAARELKNAKKEPLFVCCF